MTSSIILPRENKVYQDTGDYIALNMFPRDFVDRKPTKQEIKEISKDIALEDNFVELMPDEFVERVTQRGHAFLACSIKPIHDNPTDSRVYTTKQINFGAQSLLVQDIDNDDGKGTKPHMKRSKYGYWTWQAFLEESRRKGIDPWLIYPSASHTEEHHRYRVIYRLPVSVTDWRVAKFLVMAINEFWTMADDVSRTLCNRFYGATRGYFYRDDNAFVDPGLLAARFHYAIRRRIREEDETGRADKIEEKYQSALADFAHRTRLKVQDGAPVIQYETGSEDIAAVCQKTGFSAQMYNIIYTNGQETLKNDKAFLYFLQPKTGAPAAVFFQFEKTEQEARYESVKANKSGAPPGKKPKVGKTAKLSERQRRDDQAYEFHRNWELESARENCRRLDLALDGEDWLWHNELCHVWSQLLRVEGGTAAMRQILSSRDGHPDGGYEQEYKKEEFDPESGYQTQYLYHENHYWSCYNAPATCPYLEECQAKSIINAGRDVLAEIVRLGPDRVRPLEEIRELLPPAIERALNKARQNICLIKGDTGSGKTFAYMEKMIQLAEDEEKQVIYACPTHRLAREVYAELKTRESNYRVYYLADVEQHMPEATRREVLSLYRVGAKKKAAAMKNEWLKEAFQRVRDIPVEKRTQKAQDIIDHWQARKIVEAKGEKSCILLMTHARYMNTPGLSADVAFIDEDIFTSHLVPVMDFHIQELEELYRAMLDSGIKGSEQIRAILDEIKEAPEDGIYGISSAFLYSSDDIMKLVASGKVFGSRTKEEGTAVLEFLSGNTVAWGKSSYHVHQGRIFFVQKNELPEIKTVIASATLNRTLYSRLLGEKMHWQELPMIAYEGQLIQYPKNGYSNTSLRSSQDELLEEFQQKVGQEFCITTKTWKETLEEHGYAHNIIGTFGAIEGLNEFEGQDLTVWGALQCPPIVYGLTAYALGRRTGLGDCFQKDKGQSPIERNNYRFPFRTFSDNELLQEIHLYLTETPLVQAVGRARLVEHPATVTVYSNFILPQADVK